MPDKVSAYEIRPIKAKSIWKFHWCGECSETATHYLVRLPEPGTMDMAESRTRRCEKHAREDAKSLRIPFPSPGIGGGKSLVGMTIPERHGGKDVR